MVLWYIHWPVALRKESVDRNLDTMQIVVVVMKSLSARRAWIEINMSCNAAKFWVVALRKESVDRNFFGGRKSNLIMSRSPQGERG